MWIDTHCHLDFEPLNNNIDRELKLCYENRVNSIIVPSVKPENINKDNPQLNVRLNDTNHQPYRVILDTHLSIDLNAKILKQKKIILAFGNDPDGKLDTLQKINIHCLKLPIHKNFIDLNRLMRELTNLECNDILVESGPTLNGRLLEQNLIDELILYMAPIIMGGEANSIFNNPVLNSMQEKIKLEQKDVRYFGDNLRLIMKVLQN